jgi:hypothetical protein
MLHTLHSTALSGLSGTGIETIEHEPVGQESKYIIPSISRLV